MKKVIMLAVIFLAAACQSPESRTESTTDSSNAPANGNKVTNSPPGATTDTSGGARMDTSQTDTTHR